VRAEPVSAPRAIASVIRLARLLFAVTLECYGCKSCESYPQGNSTCVFSGMELTSQGAVVSPVWQVSCICGVHVLSRAAEGATIAFAVRCRRTRSLPESTSAMNRSRSQMHLVSRSSSARSSQPVLCELRSGMPPFVTKAWGTTSFSKYRKCCATVELLAFMMPDASPSFLCKGSSLVARVLPDTVCALIAQSPRVWTLC
jgi:hypothetical protein